MPFMHCTQTVRTILSLNKSQKQWERSEKKDGSRHNHGHLDYYSFTTYYGGTHTIISFLFHKAENQRISFEILTKILIGLSCNINTFP